MGCIPVWVGPGRPRIQTRLSRSQSGLAARVHAAARRPWQRADLDSAHPRSQLATAHWLCSRTVSLHQAVERRPPQRTAACLRLPVADRSPRRPPGRPTASPRSPPAALGPFTAPPARNQPPRGRQDGSPHPGRHASSSRGACWYVSPCQRGLWLPGLAHGPGARPWRSHTAAPGCCRHPPAGGDGDDA